MSNEKVVQFDKMNIQQLEAAFQRLEREQTQLLAKLSELQQESREHQLVIDACSKLSHSRKCFRLIGGVLVAQSTLEVKPALESNKLNIDGFINKVDDSLKERRNLLQNVQTRIAKLQMRDVTPLIHPI